MSKTPNNIRDIAPRDVERAQTTDVVFPAAATSRVCRHSQFRGNTFDWRYAISNGERFIANELGAFPARTNRAENRVRDEVRRSDRL